MRRTCSWLLVARKLGSPNFFPVSVSTSLSMVDKRSKIMVMVLLMGIRGVVKVFQKSGWALERKPVLHRKTHPGLGATATWFLPELLNAEPTRLLKEHQSAWRNQNNKDVPLCITVSIFHGQYDKNLFQKGGQQGKCLFLCFFAPPVSSSLLLHLRSFSFLVVHLVGHKKN